MAKSKKKDEFREELRRLAKNQNQRAEDAVPERRPIASQHLPTGIESDVEERLREEQVGPHAPAMDKSAYDKADSDSQRKSANKEERVVPVQVGERVKITDGIYEGSHGAVVALHYKSVEDERIAAAGTGESRFAEVDELEIRTRGSRGDLVFVKPDQVKIIGVNEYGRGDGA